MLSVSPEILTIAAVVLSFALTAGSGYFVLKGLRRLKAGQSIREEGPESHQVKAGTPTMGGIMILIGVCLSAVIVNGGLSGDMAVMLAAFLLCALIGFSDDFIKVVKKRNLGLTALQKLLFQIVIATGVAVYIARTSVFGTSVYIPGTGMYLDLGVFYIPFVAFVLVAMVNAVNLTDGLDGLASGCTSVVALFFTMLALQMGFKECSVLSASLLGGCLGFLIYNHYPAKVFMGDTGSLALGGALAVIAVMMHTELILVIAGGVFVIEVLSVIIQVVSFKSTGKRVFLMAPVHHHFEKMGWKETKVVAVFCAAAALLCVLAAVIMRLNVPS